MYSIFFKSLIEVEDKGKLELKKLGSEIETKSNMVNTSEMEIVCTKLVDINWVHELREWNY